MGMVMGKIREEVPNHRVMRTNVDYEIWRFPSQVAAVVYARDLPPGEDGEVLRDRKFSNKAFWALASYIGVVGKAENRVAAASAAAANSNTSEKIAMTAPVAMTPSSEKVSMTAPVVITPVAASSEAGEKVAMTAPVAMSPAREAGSQCMKFFLPSKYTSVAEAPVPTNAAVKMETVAEGRCHAVMQFSGNFEAERMEAMAQQLYAALERDGVKVVGDWQAMGYNPPFTLPWLKRNEVHFPVDPAPYKDEEGSPRADASQSQ